MSHSPRQRAEQLARAFLARGDCTGWFEALYEEARGDSGRIPWADMHAHRLLEVFLERDLPLGPVLVVGCGLGDDAQALATRGYAVTAFDVAESCVAWCNQRFPSSKVAYETADLLALPERYARHFGFVVEINTVQALPLNVRVNALQELARCVAPDGTLLVIAHGREDDSAPEGPPWALSRGELAALESCGLSLQRFEDFFDDEEPPGRRFVAVYRRTSRA